MPWVSYSPPAVRGGGCRTYLAIESDVKAVGYEALAQILDDLDTATQSFHS